jgi:hypothetical protein
MMKRIKWKIVRCAVGGFVAMATLAPAGSVRGADSTIPGNDRPNLFKTLRANNLSLAKSYDSFMAEGYDNSGAPNFDPATFTLSRTPDGGTSYATQYFVGWKPFGDEGSRVLGGDWTLLVSAEGNLSSSDDNTAADAVRFRATANGVYAFDGTTGLIVDASLKYEASREFDTQKLMGEFDFRPSATQLGIGRRLNLVGESTLEGGKLVKRGDVQLLWQPWLRVDVGQTLDAPAGAAEKEDTVFRLVAVVEGKLFFNNVANALNMYEVSLSAGEKFFYLPLENDRKNYNFLSVGLHFVLNTDVSIDLTYDIGRDAPAFAKQEVLTLGVGVRF